MLPTDSDLNKSLRLTALLLNRRFAPLFVTQFLGAVNDNLYKAALLIFLTHRASAMPGIDGGQMVTAAAGLFILPFLLFSALAGRLGDTRERAAMTRFIKLWEVVLMLVAAGCFFLPVSSLTLTVLMVLIFLMGVQSTFFGPIKYSLIPEHLDAGDVVSANGLVGASTFVAILVGTIAGSALAATATPVWLSGALVCTALAGWLSSQFIPPARIADPGGRVGANPVKQILHLAGQARRNRFVWRCILGISWFWTIGATFLTQLPHYADHLGFNEASVSVFLAILLTGIGVGALLCTVLVRRFGTTALSRPALITMAVAVATFALVSQVWQADVCLSDCAFTTLFHTPATAIALLGALLLTAIGGGLFAVPLYINIQLHADARHLSSSIAANNIFNALFMVAATLVTMALYALGLNVVELFYVAAAFSCAGLLVLPGQAPVKQAR